MSLRSKLAAGEVQVGLMCATYSAQVVELGGWLGADFVLIDMEHGDGIDMGGMASLIRAADAGRVPAIVRVPAAEPGYVHRLLDWGASGVCFPSVSTREAAERAVAMCKYAPEGTRSMSTVVRSTRYGTARSWEEHWPDANDEVLVIALIEDPEGVENIDAIAGVPGIDVVWIGHGDLSQILGLPRDSPVLEDARQRGLEAARANGITAGRALAASFSSDRDARHRQFQEAHDAGYRLLCWLDTMVFMAALKELLDVPRPG